MVLFAKSVVRQYVCIAILATWNLTIAKKNIGIVHLVGKKYIVTLNIVIAVKNLIGVIEMDMDIGEITEQIADYLIENSEDIISLLKEKERDELVDLIYTEITEE